MIPLYRVLLAEYYQNKQVQLIPLFSHQKKKKRKKNYCRHYTRRQEQPGSLPIGRLLAYRLTASDSDGAVLRPPRHIFVEFLRGVLFSVQSTIAIARGAMTSSIPGNRELPASQYDLSTYWGRVRHAADISDPR